MVFLLSLLTALATATATHLSDPSDVLVGPFLSFAHEVSGTLFVRDNVTLVIKDFHYDGLGPDAFFFVGTEGKPKIGATLVPYPTASDAILEKSSGSDIILTLPFPMKTSDLRWISVWCRKYGVDFGHVIIGERSSGASHEEALLLMMVVSFVAWIGGFW